MTLPPEIIATIETIPEPRRGAFVARAERITGPAQIYVIAWHLLRGDADAAIFCAGLPAEVFARHDHAIRLAWCMGMLRGP